MFKSVTIIECGNGYLVECYTRSESGDSSISSQENKWVYEDLADVFLKISELLAPLEEE